MKNWQISYELNNRVKKKYLRNFIFYSFSNLFLSLRHVLKTTAVHVTHRSFIAFFLRSIITLHRKT